MFPAQSTALAVRDGRRGMVGLGRGERVFEFFAFGRRAGTRHETSAAPVRRRHAIAQAGPRVQGKIGQTYQDSKQDFPQPVKAPAGLPMSS